MCDSTLLAGRAVTRPRWRELYVAVGLPLATLGIVEVATPPAPVRTLLRLALVLGTVAAMAVWVRADRAALDLHEWCACAASTVTVRVIESQRPAVSPRPDPLPASPAWVEEDREVEVASRYLNLLQPQDRKVRRPGDSTEVLAARRRFLDSPTAAPLVGAIVDLLSVSEADAVPRHPFRSSSPSPRG